MGNRMKGWSARLQTLKERLLKIPAIQLLFRTAEGAGNHDAAQRAAGIAYYTILSLLPLLLGLIAIFDIFFPSVNLQDGLQTFIGKNLPGAADIVSQDIVNNERLQGLVGVLSIIVFFWGASAAFSAVSLAINRAWCIGRQRHFIIRKASELGMVLSTGVLFLLSLAASAVISILRGVVELPAASLVILDLGSRLAAFLLMLAVFLLLYKLIPNIKTDWRNIWPGALAAAILFEIARTLFIFYLEHFASYQLIYGSIASVIILLVWIYYSAFIMVLGAEFTYQYSHKRHSNNAVSSTSK
jgi:membrane protein